MGATSTQSAPIPWPTSLQAQARATSSDFEPIAAAALKLLDDREEWSSFGQVSKTLPDCWDSCVVLDRPATAAEATRLISTLRGLVGVQGVRLEADGQRLHMVWAPAQIQPSAWLLALQSLRFNALPARDVHLREARRQGLRRARRDWQIAAAFGALVLLCALPGYAVFPTAWQRFIDANVDWPWHAMGTIFALPILLRGNWALLNSGLHALLRERAALRLLAALACACVWGLGSLNVGDFGSAYMDTYAWLVFALLYVRWLELRSQDRCAMVLESAQNTLPDSVERQTPHATFERVALRHIQVGDHLRVMPGETFLADGVIEQGATMVNEAHLTGASRAIYRRFGDTVLAGSINASAMVHVRVERLAAHTRLDAMQVLMAEAASARPLPQRGGDRLAFITLCCAAVCIGLLQWLGSFEGASFSLRDALVWTALALSALAIGTPLALLAAARRLRRDGVLVRQLAAMERLACVSTLIFGKTGTLTQDTMVLDDIECRAGENGTELLYKAAALARHSLHPASRALCAAIGTPRAAVRSYAGPEWTCSQVIDTPGAGLEGSACATGFADHSLRLGSSAFCGVPPIPDVRFAVYLSDARGWLATFTLDEALRAQAALVVTRLNQARVAVHMLSGDKADAVRRMARVLGISDARGGCSPHDKLQAVQTLQANAQVVAMVGDGMSDGPALAGADVSIALGNALPRVHQVSDIVVPVEHVGLVADAVVLSRKTRRVARQNGVFLLSAYTLGAALAASSLLSQIPGPVLTLFVTMVSSLVVLANAWRLTRKVATQRNQL